METELQPLENSQERLEELHKEYKEKYRVLHLCRVLSMKRKSWVEFLEKKLTEELADLTCPKQLFCILPRRSCTGG